MDASTPPPAPGAAADPPNRAHKQLVDTKNKKKHKNKVLHKLKKKVAKRKRDTSRSWSLTLGFMKSTEERELMIQQMLSSDDEDDDEDDQGEQEHEQASESNLNKI